MLIGRHGGGWQVFGPDGGLVASIPGRMQTDQHIQNFLDCIRNGGLPVCDIEAAHISTALGHIGNISYRLGKRQLRFDGASERFTKDNEANLMLKRTYREPWVIHEEV